MSRTARSREGRTGIERLTGDSIDISEWVALPQDNYTDEAFDVNIGSELLTTNLGDFH
jgi:hypothetical protein